MFLLAVGAVAVFVHSPFGAALMGTRDQPRRMNALGYHVWMIRFYACLVSGLLTAYPASCSSITPNSSARRRLSLTCSAEVLLMVIAGGPAACLVRSSARRWWWSQDRGQRLHRALEFLLGAIFVAIVILVPEGMVPGTIRLRRLARRKRSPAPPRPKPAPTEAAP